MDVRIILKWMWDVGTDWMDVAEDRDSWRAFVNAVCHLDISERCLNSLQMYYVVKELYKIFI